VESKNAIHQHWVNTPLPDTTKNNLVFAAIRFVHHDFDTPLWGNDRAREFVDDF
jgi:hypothetical protein